jgi:hypothetical protein
MLCKEHHTQNLRGTRFTLKPEANRQGDLTDTNPPLPAIAPKVASAPEPPLALPKVTTPTERRNRMREQCGTCGKQEETLALITHKTSNGKVEIRMCVDCHAMYLVMLHKDGWQPIFTDGRKTLAGVWFSDDFWNKLAPNTEAPDFKAEFQAIAVYLEKGGTPIDGIMAHIRADMNGFRVVQNWFDTKGGRFVMFQGFSAPGEVDALGPPSSSPTSPRPPSQSTDILIPVSALETPTQVSRQEISTDVINTFLDKKDLNGLINCGSAAVPFLTSCLSQDAPPWKVMLIADVLAEIGDATAIAPLKRELSNWAGNQPGIVIGSSGGVAAQFMHWVNQGRGEVRLRIQKALEKLAHKH